MGSLKPPVSVPPDSQRAAVDENTNEVRMTEEGTSCEEPPVNLFTQAYHVSDDGGLDFLAQSKTHNPTQRGSEEPVSGTDGSVAGDGSLSQDQDDGNSSFTSSYETQQDEYPDDDEEFIANTREQTSKEHVIQLKWDLLLERDQARKAKKELADYKAIQEKIWQNIRLNNDIRFQSEVRGDPKPPRLGSTIHQPLYDNLVDRLCECTVHVLLNRARDNYDIGDFQQSEHHAERALVNQASKLEYEPLSAWCRFHMGKAQYGQGKYQEALASFEEAEKAIGFYVQEEVIDMWVSKVNVAELRRARGGTTSFETEPLRKNLADELAGSEHVGSSNDSA